MAKRRESMGGQVGTQTDVGFPPRRGTLEGVGVAPLMHTPKQSQKERSRMHARVQVGRQAGRHLGRQAGGAGGRLSGWASGLAGTQSAHLETSCWAGNWSRDG